MANCFTKKILESDNLRLYQTVEFSVSTTNYDLITLSFYFPSVILPFISVCFLPLYVPAWLLCNYSLLTVSVYYIYILYSYSILLF